MIDATTTRVCVGMDEEQERAYWLELVEETQSVRQVWSVSQVYIQDGVRAGEIRAVYATEAAANEDCAARNAIRHREHNPERTTLGYEVDSWVVYEEASRAAQEATE